MGRIISGLVRHVLTTVGGGLLARGVLTEGDLELLIGALVTIVGIAASVLSKMAIAKTADDAKPVRSK